MNGTSTDQPRGSSDRTISRRIPALLALLAVVALACTCSNLANPAQLLRNAIPGDADQVLGEIEGTLQAVSTPPTPGPSGGDLLPDLVASGRLDLVGIQGSAGGETLGRILTVQVTNPSSDEVIARIPCGLVFEPAGGGVQRMMVIQPESASLPAGDARAMEPYVACIDPELEAPDEASTFSLGAMASGDLLKLATCICDEPLEGQLSVESGMQLLGVQMAVWSAATGDSPRALMDRDISGAAGEVLGDEASEFLGGMTDLLLAPADAWLERCGVQVEE